MKNKEYQSIVKMIDYINRAKEYTKNTTFEQFSKDNMMIDATVFSISQIGELVKNFDKEFQDKYSNVRWHILKGVRNKIIHDYEGIQLNLIWDIVNVDLDELKTNLQKILDENDEIQ